MKKVYVAPSLEGIFTMATEDILSLSQSQTIATINDGPSVGFDQFF